MKININYKKNIYEVDTRDGVPISIPTKFNNSESPKFYDTTSPRLDYFKLGEKVYKIDDGAGCNVPTIYLNIHCQGTHTETALHISDKGVKISEINDIDFLASQIITVSATSSSKDSYHSNYSKDDMVITKKMINNAISDMNFIDCLIIRTLPNGDFKFGVDYNKNKYAFLSNDAVEYLLSIGVKHLIVDTPSIDMYDDGGVLGNHQIFFKDNNGSFNKNTITEMAFIPNSISDGLYFTTIKFLNLDLDASPSVPIVFKFKKI